MKNLRAANFNIFIISAVVICFEIISTRISSVIFVQNYAFMILSFAILGLGGGGIFAYYKIKIDKNGNDKLSASVVKFLILTAVSLIVFITIIIVLEVTNPFFYFFLLFLPFFFAGIVYSQLFKNFSDNSFKLYASDLIGAAIGSALSLGIFALFTAPNAVLFLSVIIFASALFFIRPLINKNKFIGISSALILSAVLLVIYGQKDFLGRVPIGNYPEKDFYHVYDNVNVESKIIESRWGINGRSDLVEYSHQDVVKQLFIDGSAGSQMYRFNGDVKNPDELLENLLIRHSTSIPFLFLRESEKNNMLIIGPGGGKEVVTGLINGVQRITGVEVNPDFVDIVKKYSDYNGGIYTNFPNVNIEIAEGRHFIKQSEQKYDIILMALPSTEQLQSIDNFASNENFLLTVEAIKDYLKILTTEGRLIFTVHNRWELVRLLVTTMYAFKEVGVNNSEALNHFIVLGEEYAPTVIIKKNKFSEGEISYLKGFIKTIPPDLPRVTYLPYSWNEIDNSVENRLLKTINANQTSIEDYIKNDPYDISPVRDDSPYFYKVNRGVPDDYFKLLIGVVALGVLFIAVPISKIKKAQKKNKNEIKIITAPLLVFISIGLGFMILEVSLFQKLILYLGSPTVSLSILLGSLLIGMGTGSFFGGKIYEDNLKKRLKIISVLIVAAGIILFLIAPLLLNQLLAYSRVLRSLVSFLILLPFGFLLGIPFPTCLKILKHHEMEKYIPWMYGVNGIMSVLGSILAVVFSMLVGFTAAFFIGLLFYLAVFFITNSSSAKQF